MNSSVNWRPDGVTERFPVRSRTGTEVHRAVQQTSPDRRVRVATACRANRPMKGLTRLADGTRVTCVHCGAEVVS